MSYNTRIIRQQGGSEMTVASGGSLNFELGGQVKFGADAAPALNTAYPVIKMGNNTFWYSPSAAAPTLSGSPGDLLWVPASASTAFYVNTSDGTGGSVWTATRLVGGGSQLLG